MHRRLRDICLVERLLIVESRRMHTQTDTMEKLKSQIKVNEKEIRVLKERLTAFSSGDVGDPEKTAP